MLIRTTCPRPNPHQVSTEALHARGVLIDLVAASGTGSSARLCHCKGAAAGEEGRSLSIVDRCGNAAGALGLTVHYFGFTLDVIRLSPRTP